MDALTVYLFSRQMIGATLKQPLVLMWLAVLKMKIVFFSNVGRYELLVGIEGSLGLGLMLGRKEIVGAGQYIGEYTDIVTVYDKNDTSNYNANLVNGKYVIDAKDSLNILKYCNHSCKPNAYLQVYRHSDGSLRVGMFSKRSIQPFSWINICYCKGKALKGFF